jgi:hypothetical protein
MAMERCYIMVEGKMHDMSTYGKRHEVAMSAELKGAPTRVETRYGLTDLEDCADECRETAGT